MKQDLWLRALLYAQVDYLRAWESVLEHGLESLPRYWEARRGLDLAFAEYVLATVQNR